jgi:hypothetical protein
MKREPIEVERLSWDPSPPPPPAPEDLHAVNWVK